MSRDLEDIAVDLTTCGYCGQPAGEWCRTKGGHRSTFLHGQRVDALREAWANGYSEGGREALTLAREYIEKDLWPRIDGLFPLTENDRNTFLAQMSAHVRRFLP